MRVVQHNKNGSIDPSDSVNQRINRCYAAPPKCH